MDYKPNNITDCLDCVELELEKSQLLMGLLVQDYPFDGDPDATTLMCNYKQMAVFIDYVHGSMCNIKQILLHAMEFNKSNKKEQTA